MNSEGIKLAREILDLPDTVTDEEIADGLRGSFLEARIEFRLAWNELKEAYLGLIRPYFMATVQWITGRLMGE